LAVAPSNSNILYAGMETGGIFKTIDKGLNWTPVTHNYAIGNIQDIKVDPNNSNIVYAARGEDIYKTSNGGNTWDLIATVGGTIQQFLINTNNTNTIYAATSIGVLKSDDAGSNWNNIMLGEIFDIESKPGSNTILYIARNNAITKRPEIFKSTDAGNNWTLMDNGYYMPSDLSVAEVYGCKIGVTPADPNRIYAGIIATGKTDDNGWIGIYYSLDEGNTWQEDSGFDGGPYASGDDVNTNWYVAGYSNGYHQGFYNFDIDVSHINPDKLWIGTIWYCESGNKGGNIEYIRGTRNLEMHADIQDIDVIGNEIWIASDGGINYSNDECQTVEVRTNGITASDFWGFGQGWNEDVWVGGRYHNGNAAFHENYGIGNSVFLGGAEDATGYVNQFNNKKAYFTDISDKIIPEDLNTASSDIPNLGMYPTQSYFHFDYSEVEWHPNYANTVFIGKDNSIYKSIDGGANYTSIFTFNGEIRRFEISRANPEVIYAIVKESYWVWKVYKSLNGGNSFVALSTPNYSSGSWRNLSLALNPFDENELWLASNSSNNGNKLFRSLNGGNSWSNQYNAILQDENIKDMIFQKSINGDFLYVMTNNNYFYLDMFTFTWNNYAAGLPFEHKGFVNLPFYRNDKIRMASAKGIWEAPFVEESLVQAMPMIEKDKTYCSRDTISFESYSILNPLNATFNWSFSPSPLYLSDANARNPKVVFGSEGNYDVLFEITQNGQSYSKQISDFIQVQSYCEADSIPGQCLTTTNDGDYAIAQDANLSNITHFTVTGWWKPNGAQDGFAALFSSGDWCAHCDYTEGLIVDYWGNKLWYKWPGNGSDWGSNSGITIPIDEWSYVALVIEPNKATLYLNEQKYEHNIPLDPGDINSIYLGYGHYSKSFKGDIDEVTLWKRALQESEIRLLRHLTKEDIILNDQDLIAYYQFNDAIDNTLILDKAKSKHANLKNGAFLSNSNAPVGGGKSAMNEIVFPGYYNFAGTDMTLAFLNGSLPNGELVVSKINLNPNVLPNVNSLENSYWIINNYGSNTNITALESIQINNLEGIYNSTDAQNFKLYQRSSNAHANNWLFKNNADEILLPVEAVKFENSLTVNNFGQFFVDAPRPNIWIGVANNNWHNTLNWADNSIPGIDAFVVIPANTPFHPIVSNDATIRLLTINEGAQFYVNQGIQFEVTNTP